MANLDRRRINFVKRLPIDVRAQVLYLFLKEGISNRKTEQLIDALNEEDGWQAWSVIHFYGFNSKSKARFPTLTLKRIKDSLLNVNVEELEEFHLANSEEKELSSKIVFTENDGKDVFRTIKGRQGQYKLRKALVQNYRSKCGLCRINDPKLLITSHIKTWSTSSANERIDTTNAILLCKLHDALFEYGYISFTDNYEVLYSLDYDFEGQGIAKDITFTKPVRDFPSSVFLREHRLKHGFE
ncbi:HNH endonuclease [Heyndrickxia oleronia]|uniref:HNH endonuclease signature motif containing protein n=1 Tax=Heyndrickxia oleronia TaxID=38875 RepID=A0AAW6T297_9BACI|nr:HNH endonuclease signature motif containing protein [Heyndrickxia oleronia]MDH5163920.1 HNH endonuclease signature motif containing protein [Heyndrickxia oleronia]